MIKFVMIVLGVLFAVFVSGLSLVPLSMADRATVQVDIMPNTSVPGCEEVESGCYSPATVVIGSGSEVMWTNTDTASHTVASGTVAERPDGVFDSGLVTSGQTFSFKFEDAGDYPYYCLIHPWMVGSVHVQGTQMPQENITFPTPTISLDKRVYSWTDKIYITIESLGSNSDSNLIEYIGSTDQNAVYLSTGVSNIDKYKLVESGRNTGIFHGEVTLTGFNGHSLGKNGEYNSAQTSADKSGPTGGYLETRDKDTFEISFGYVEGESAIASALIRWNIASIEWLDASYPASASGIVRISDPDMNLDPESVDNFEVDVWSDSDAGGIRLTVTETNEATGIFEGAVSFTVTDESSGHRLRVAEGDTVTAEYDDYTLPGPYGPDDYESISAISLVQVSPKYAALVSWLDASYPVSSSGIVRIIDPDMNLNPESADSFGVDVWSDSDAGGIRLTVTETNEATGIFEGAVSFTVTDESSGHRLRVAEGDTITAEYDDYTLPGPYGPDDYESISAISLVQVFTKMGSSEPSTIREGSTDVKNDTVISDDHRDEHRDFNLNPATTDSSLDQAADTIKGDAACSPNLVPVQRSNGKIACLTLATAETFVSINLGTIVKQ